MRHMVKSVVVPVVATTAAELEVKHTHTSSHTAVQEDGNPEIVTLFVEWLLLVLWVQAQQVKRQARTQAGADTSYSSYEYEYGNQIEKPDHDHMPRARQQRHACGEQQARHKQPPHQHCRS